MALSLTPHLHLRLFIGTHPSIFSSLTSLPAPPRFCPDPSCRISFSSTLLFTPYLHLFPPPSFVFTPSFFTSSSFPCFVHFFFPRFGKRWQPWPKHTRALVNSSYDMQMRVKILTVYLTHITQLNARAGATAAVWACACLPVNCVPAHSVLMKKKQPHLLLSSWIWEKRKQ